MAKKTVSVLVPADVNARLEEIGFPRSVIDETRDVWTAAMNSGTPFHAKSYPGTLGYHEGVATLRMEGQSYGLEGLNREGVELCVNPTTRNAVVIVQGDARTGDIDNLHLKPSTKYPRGEVSRDVLIAQLLLFPEEKKTNVDPYDVWVLLLYKIGDETRAELSRPRFIDDNGTILDWHERIFLGAQRGSGMPTSASGSNDLAPTGDVVVPVKART